MQHFSFGFIFGIHFSVLILCLLRLKLATSSFVLHRSVSRIPATRSYSQQRKDAHIVIVDDEEAIRMAVGDFLLHQGYRVTACSDAQTALQLLSPEGNNDGIIPDAIVTDVRMPGAMDGLELLKFIRASSKLVGIPVVLLTAKGMTSDRIAGYKAGADAYLPKPFHPEELVSILDNLIERHETLSAENIGVDDLRKDMNEIKKLVMEKTRNTGDNIDRSAGGTAICWNDVFLTTDERQVLELLCKGLTNKEISKEMKLSQRRIEQFLTSMYRKTNAINRTELLRWAISTGNIILGND